MLVVVNAAAFVVATQQCLHMCVCVCVAMEWASSACSDGFVVAAAGVFVVPP